MGRTQEQLVRTPSLWVPKIVVTQLVIASLNRFPAPT